MDLKIDSTKVLPLHQGIKEYTLKEIVSSQCYISELTKIVSSVAAKGVGLTPEKLSVASGFNEFSQSYTENIQLNNAIFLHYLIEPLSMKEIVSKIKKISAVFSFEQKQYLSSLLKSLLDEDPESECFSNQLDKLLQIPNTVTSSNFLDGLFDRVKLKNSSKIDLSFLDVNALKSDLVELEKEYVTLSHTNNTIRFYEDSISTIEKLLSERINHIYSQISLDKEMILAEFNDVVSDVVIESECAMLGRLVSSDITRNDIWEKFGKEQSALILESRLNRANSRINKILEQRNRDIDALTKDLSEAKNSINLMMSRGEATALIPSTSLVYKLQNRVDDLTDNITSAALFGGGIAGLGMASGLVSAGALATLFATPVGLGVLGVTGASALYQFITKSDQRAFMQLSEVSKKLEKQLCSKLDYHMKQIESEFSVMVGRLSEFSDNDIKEYLGKHHLQILCLDYSQEVRRLTVENTNKLLKMIDEPISLEN